jgi:hypothetical protein
MAPETETLDIELPQLEKKKKKTLLEEREA